MGRPTEGPVLRLKNGVWSVRFRHQGRRFELSTRTSVRSDAEREARALFEQHVTSRCVRPYGMRRASAQRILGVPPIFPWPEIPGVYCACVFTGYAKIGRAGNIASRMCDFQTHTPEDVRLLCILSDDPRDERAFHLRFRAWRIRGEWFRLDAGFVAALREATGT